uniref:Uncharacterized protein n=1 Tax=Nicotiana tabacum TaxID=4097 RepID=A0A1S4A017_TOBAC|nr:PREDICTED: uncharacterized protein LOC107792339 [Nicotiana tabacum]
MATWVWLGVSPAGGVAGLGMVKQQWSWFSGSVRWWMTVWDDEAGGLFGRRARRDGGSRAAATAMDISLVVHDRKVSWWRGAGRLGSWWRAAAVEARSWAAAAAMVVSLVVHGCWTIGRCVVVREDGVSKGWRWLWHEGFLVVFHLFQR